MAKVLIITILAVFLGCGWGDPKPGEMWEYCSDLKNPYEKSKCERYFILHTQDGYVQYEIMESDYYTIGKIESNSIWYFKVGSKKIKGYDFLQANSP